MRTKKNTVWMACSIAAMCAVVVLSNYLVQFPVHMQLGSIALQDLLTWAAFTYPIAFLVTDIANRALGPQKARIVVYAGFVLAVILSLVLATPRIAVASGTAFLMAQTLDITIFNQLRRGKWWWAPVISSVIGSLLDTIVFFSIAFAPLFEIIGPNDSFALADAPLLGVFGMEVPRWISWASGDFAVKILVGLMMLVPYGFVAALVKDREIANSAPQY